ncbi:MAG: protein TolA [Legionellales bacterium]|nr:protein TolA [Legionellales bacterium]|tara:strand:- start:866 stop:1714 length:849 start_codon:yes stop_codon:yes gene_type:complete
MDKRFSFKKAFMIALSLHVVVLAALVVTGRFSPAPSLPAVAQSQKVDIVKGVTIDQTKVEAEVAKIKHLQAKKRADEKAYLRKLNEQAAAAKRKQTLAQQKVKQLKDKQAKLAKESQAKQATEKARLDKLKQQQMKEQQQLAKLEKEKQQAIAARKKRLEDDLRRETEAMMQQQLAQEGEQLNAVRQKQLQSQIAKYTTMINQQISQNWIVPDNSKDLSCLFLIKLAPGGMVEDVTLLKSSGDPVLDRSAQAAVYKASPLPVPNDPALFKTFREIRLNVHPA